MLVNIKELTAEIVEDLKENGEQLRDRATAPVKEAYDKAYNRVTETVNREKIAKAAKDVNEYALKTATEVVDGAIASVDGNPVQPETAYSTIEGLFQHIQAAIDKRALNVQVDYDPSLGHPTNILIEPQDGSTETITVKL